MNASPLLLAIIGHLVGDYLLQNDWMALNKKRPGPVGAWPCSIHSALWAATVCSFAGWWRFDAITGIFSVPVTLFIAHYWQDRTRIISRWMRLIGQGEFASGPCAPWSVIVVDNVWHIVSLWAVWRFLA